MRLKGLLLIRGNLGQLHEKSEDFHSLSSS